MLCEIRVNFEYIGKQFHNLYWSEFFHLFFSLSLICYILVVKDLVGLYHDTGDIAREKVVVSYTFYTRIDCAKTSTNATSSRAWPMLYNDTLCRNRFLLLLLCRLHLIELTFRNDY